MSAFRLTVWCVGVSLAVLTGCSERAKDGEMNLLIVCLDTVRADTFSQLGELPDDPLAPWQGSALDFRRAQATSPWTVPSIASAFTGLRPNHHGAGLRDQGALYTFMESIGQMHKTVPTVAESAHQTGYKTAVISASPWTADRFLGLGFGLSRGFEDFENLFTEQGLLSDWQPLVAVWRDKYLPAAEGSGFVHFLHLMDAHNWHITTKEQVAEMRAAIPEQRLPAYMSMAPAGICQNPDSGMCRRFLVYTSAVNAMRESVARMLEILQEENLLDKTIVIVFSDHGEEFWDHHGDERSEDKKLSAAVMKGWHGIISKLVAGDGPAIPVESAISDIASNREELEKLLPAFGHGMTLYQEMLHVPLLVWHPESAGRSIETRVSLLDIAPSIAGWLELPFETENISGRPLGNSLNQADSSVVRSFYGSAVSIGQERVSVLRENKKAIWNVTTDHTNYFDIARDPLERHPVTNDQLVMMFDSFFYDYIQTIPEAPAQNAELDDARIQDLQSIGYLQGIETPPPDDDGDHTQ